MAIENYIYSEDLARVRSIDFTYQFTGGIQKLLEALGTARAIPVQEGTVLKAYKVTGELESGVVTEGELVPLSHYETTYETIGEAALHIWRKSTSAKAISEKGYDQAVGDTTDKMVKDVQKEIRKDFFAALALGTGTASGATLQPALANAWGKLQILFEDDAVDTVYFLNPTDVADYLGNAQVTVQNAFGMKYIEDFLGLGTVFLNSFVPAGSFYATAKDNLVLYFINMANGDVANTFGLTTDETGYIGIREYLDEDHASVSDLVMAGVSFFPENLAGIVVGTIGGNATEETEETEGE